MAWRSSFVRRALFQVHVWAGIITGLYALFIGVTGAALMFRSELQRHTYPTFFSQAPAGAPLADAAVVLRELETRFPGYRFSGIDYPNARRGTFLAYLSNGGELRTVFSDPVTGAVIGELPHDGWIQQLQELHFTFLMGQPGYLYNGIGAACLLTMCVTGIVLWWPGLGRVGQAFVVHLRRGWKRVIWELHGAVGIWTLAWLVVWSVSGIYFSFPVPFQSAVATVATLTPYPYFESGPPPADAAGRDSRSGPVATAPAPSDLIARAHAKFPTAQLARFTVPSGDRGVYSVVLARERHGDGDSSDEVTVYFDRYTGAELAVKDARVRTAGDDFLTWLGRLHTGNFGGWPIKFLWFATGLAFPLLFVSGATMFFNRKKK